MTRWTLLMCFLAISAMAQTGNGQGQGPDYRSQPYQPAVPAPSMNTSYGGYYGGGTTAAGSAMNGLGSAMSGAGSMHLSNSAAAINWTQAQKNEIQNHQLGESTYFQMRNENQAWQKAQQKPPATKDQMARWAREIAPKPISASEVDLTSGQVNWPDALTQDAYSQQRADLQQLMTKMATYGRLGYQDQLAARSIIESMFGVLKSQIQDIPSPDYVAARAFLRSLIYATSKTELDS